MTCSLRIVRGDGIALGFEIKMMAKIYDWLVNSLPSGEKSNFIEWRFRVAAEGFPDLSIVNVSLDVNLVRKKGNAKD